MCSMKSRVRFIHSSLQLKHLVSVNLKEQVTCLIRGKWCPEEALRDNHRPSEQRLIQLMLMTSKKDGGRQMLKGPKSDKYLGC